MVMLSALPTPAPAARWRRGIEGLVGGSSAFTKATAGQSSYENWLASRSSEGAKTGAGEGIRTLDPDLGKVVLYP